MADRRRSGRGRRYQGGGALDIQGTLGTLLRSTLHQVGMVRDVVERQARSSLANLDHAMLQRKRRDTLARLGELAYEMIRDHRAGMMTGHPEVGELIAEVEEIDERLQEWPQPEPGMRSRSRRGAPASADDTVSSADWRPPVPRAAADEGARQRVWRPEIPPDDEEPAPAAGGSRPAGSRPDASVPGRAPDTMETARTEPEVAASPRARRRSRRRDTGGGIAFVSDTTAMEDDDLAEYMHEDDVPRRD